MQPKPIKRFAIFAALVIPACVTNPPIPVTDDLAAPIELLRPVCESWDYPHIPSGAHWDGHARFVWTTNREVIAVDCSLTRVGTDGLDTMETRVDIREERAKALRDFLTQNDIPITIPWLPAP